MKRTYLYGIISADNGENVIGYFEVVSETEKRLFFNYEDFFPEEPLPIYAVPCVATSRPESHRSYCDPGPGGTAGLQSVIEGVNIGVFAYEGVDPATPNSYITTSRACGDCTELGNSVVPEFWVE